LATGGGPHGAIMGAHPVGMHMGGSQLCRLEKTLPIILNGRVIAENNAEIGLNPPSSGPQAGIGQGGKHLAGLGPAIAGPAIGAPGCIGIIPGRPYTGTFKGGAHISGP